MRERASPITVLNQTWTRLGQGSFQVAYRSSDGKQVLKFCLSQDQKDLELNDPARQARIFSAIHPQQQKEVKAVDTKYGTALLMPYIQGKMLDDEEMVNASIMIYKKTRRVIWDIFVSNNILKTADGEFVVIDTALALRNDSTTSFNCINRFSKEYQTKLWLRNEKQFPQTIRTIKALQLLNDGVFSFTRDDKESLAELIKEDPLLRYTLARLYDIIHKRHYTFSDNQPKNNSDEEKIKRALQTHFRYKKTIDFTRFQELCCNENQHFIIARVRLRQALKQAPASAIKKSAVDVYFEVKAASNKKTNISKAKLTEILETTKTLITLSSQPNLLLSSPYQRTLNQFQCIDIQSHFGKKLASAMMIFAGVCLMAVGIMGIAHTAGASSILFFAGKHLMVTGCAISAGAAIPVTSGCTFFQYAKTRNRLYEKTKAFAIEASNLIWPANSK